LEEAQASLKRAKDSQAREIATAQVAVDQATFSLSQIEEARQRALFNRSAASRDDVDRASASRERSGAQVDADRASLDQAKVDYEINILTAQANVDAAAAAVRQAEIDLSYCTIISPIDGRVGEAKVKVGNLVGPMTSAGGADYTELTTIQQLDPMGVDIQCASRYLERATRLIKQGLDVSLVRPGAEGDQPTVYTGRCFFIDNKIDPATSTVLIKASVGNPERTLLPGEYVKLDMTVGQVPDAVVVPERAVIETQEGPTVYVVGDDDTVAVVPVTAEFVHDHMRVITKGLKPGQRVIVEGIQLVRPGQKVQAKPEPAAGNSDGQASAASLKAEH
jgi:membrane fusion protein (multidrug efflux system)